MNKQIYAHFVLFYSESSLYKAYTTIPIYTASLSRGANDLNYFIFSTIR